MFQFRRSPLRTGQWMAGAVLAALWLLHAPGGTAAQESSPDFAPGFGLIYGEGRTEEDTNAVRYGFTSRRLSQDDKAGSIAFLFEEHFNGIPFSILDPSVTKDGVELRYQSLFVEIKRYFPLGGNFHFYWGLRGGFTRITGKIRRNGQETAKFETTQIAPLALLALPLAFEHPGFLLLAFVEGTSIGLTFDIIPNRLWLDFQTTASLIPDHRDELIAIDQPAIVTQILQLALVF